MCWSLGGGGRPSGEKLAETVGRPLLLDVFSTETKYMTLSSDWFSGGDPLNSSRKLGVHEEENHISYL